MRTTQISIGAVALTLAAAVAVAGMATASGQALAATTNVVWNNGAGRSIPGPATLALTSMAGAGLLTIKRRKKP